MLTPTVTEPMQQALIQACRVEGRTSPRPPVGAVIVRDGRIIAQGATAPPYGPHAEIEALTAAGPLARGADLYVTLEPCCVTIHTPPCTRAIIAAGIRRVFIAAQDPNPLVAGQGIAQLEAAGITVLMQPLARATQLVQPFAAYITQQRSYVTAKWAMTLDGKIASRTGDARWISSPASRAWVHDLRDRIDAILIGANTARVDNPQLTVRLTEEQQATSQRSTRLAPWRVILATHGMLPEHLTLLQPAMAERTMLLIGENCPAEQRQRLEQRGIQYLSVETDKQKQINITAALRVLAQQGIMHVLLEGGAHLLGSAFESHCVDHVAAFIAPRIVGGATAPSPVAGTGRETIQQAWQLQHRRTEYIDNDILIEGDVVYD